MGSEDPAYARYIRPFELVERLNLNCGYEKSFKLTDRHLLRNRYLLGIESKQLDAEKLELIFEHLGMPDEYVEAFWQDFDAANLVLIGFEEGLEYSSYKVYLEFWDQIQAGIEQTADAVTMFLGYKWNTEDNSRRTITDYRYFPHLDVQQITRRIDDLEAESGDSELFAVTRAIVELAARHAGEQPLVYLEASEADNPRRSFDINLYPAGLRLQHVQLWIDQLARKFSLTGRDTDELFAKLNSAFLGHLSGGVGRDGDGFFSVYYENEAGGAT